MENTHRGPAMVGELPQDFLRTDRQLNASQSEEASRRVAENLAAADVNQSQPVMNQQGVVAAPGVAAQQFVTVGRLSITVVQARLAKSYSMLNLTKMDPYCRIRVGHTVLETETCYNGAKEPKWGKTFYATLPRGVDSFSLEIFDEKSFKTDERIAWMVHNIPDRVLQGETLDEWYPLSGKQGDLAEGQVNLIISYSKFQQPVYSGMNPVLVPGGANPLIMPQGNMPTHQFHAQPPINLPPPFTEEDVNQVKEMFPTMENDIIKSILAANNGNKDRAINQILQMQ